MWLVKYITKDGPIYRRYKYKTEEQVRKIADAAFKKGWRWASMTKEY